VQRRKITEEVLSGWPVEQRRIGEKMRGPAWARG
jgi:hypothetical protein